MSARTTLMLPVKHFCFQLAVVCGVIGFSSALLQAAEPPVSKNPAQKYFDGVELKIRSLQLRVKDCLSGGCGQDSEVIWVVSRSVGQSRIVRGLSAIPQWMPETEYRRILASIGALPAPNPRLESDPPLSMVLSERDEWKTGFLVLEYATGFPTERLLAVVNPKMYFADLLAPGAESRRWLLFNTGEVLAQSDDHFSGALLGDREYFKRIGNTGVSQERSFDQMDVTSYRHSLSEIGLILLFETPLSAEVSSKSWWLQDSVSLARRWAWAVLSVLLVSFALHRWRQRPRLARKKILPISLPSDELHRCIYGSRSLGQLGMNFCSALKKATGCEVLFLEFDWQNGQANELGSYSEKMEVRMSPLGIRPGRVMPEIPALRSAIVRYKDVSRFLAWPLMAEGESTHLLGFFVLLSPTARVQASTQLIATWVERAARYHQSILSQGDQNPQFLSSGALRNFDIHSASGTKTL